MRKVAIIDPIGGHGGMDYYCYGLAMGLGENNTLVSYFTSTETSIREFKNVSTELTFKNVWSSGNKFIKLYRYYKGLRKAIKKAKASNCEIIHLQLFDFSKLAYLQVKEAKKTGAKVVATIHDVSSLKDDNHSSLRASILELIDWFIVHNEYSEKELKGFLDSNKISVIQHGNYLPFVNPITIKSTIESKLNLLFFGQIKEVKGVDVLLKAMKILKENEIKIHLTIAGKPWHTEVSKYISFIEVNQLADMVECRFEFIPDNEVEDYYSKADLIILPYKKIYQSGVVLMSMSYGKPVLVSDLDPFKEIIKDNENGWIFHSEDPKSLAYKILEISNDREKFNEVAQKGREYVEKNHDWKLLALDIIESYRHALG